MGNVLSCVSTPRGVQGGLAHPAAAEEKIEFLHDGLIWRSTLASWHTLPAGFEDQSHLKQQMPEEFRCHLHRLELQRGGVAERKIFDALARFGVRLTAATLREMMLEGAHPELNESLGVLLHYHLLDFKQLHEHDAHCSNGLFGERHCTIMHRMAVDGRELQGAVGTSLAERFNLLADAGVDLDAACAHHETPLMWAVQWGTLGAAKALVSAGADMHRCDNHGLMPIHLAAKIGEADKASLLARASGQPNVATHDRHHQAAAHLAAAHGHCKVIRSLQHCGANFNMLDADHASPLLLAVKHRQIAAVRTLVAYGANPNLRMGLHGYAALHWAAQHDRLDGARALSQCGADPNVRTSDGHTPLHITALRHAEISHSVPRSLEFIDLLIEAGAHIDLRDRRGWQAIDVAAKEGNEPVFNHLLKYGATPQFELDMAVVSP